MGKIFYRMAVPCIQTLTHRMTVEWEEPFEEGPCVFIGNHLGAIGPVDMCAKFPLRDRIHPWINNGVLETRLVPAYVRQDYWWRPESRLAPLMNVTVPYLVAPVLPFILRSVQYIPVYHDQRVMTTLRQSLRVLQQGDYVLIFPEKAAGWHSYQDELNMGWLRLGELWHRISGQPLKIIPVHIDVPNGVFRVSRALYFDPERSCEDQQDELAEALLKGLRK